MKTKNKYFIYIYINIILFFIPSMVFPVSHLYQYRYNINAPELGI